MIDNEFGNDILTLEDDDGVEHTFEVLDAIDNGENRYMALSPVYDDPQQTLEDSGELVILKVVTVDGEEFLETIEDEDEMDEIADIFMERLEEDYDVIDEESSRLCGRREREGAGQQPTCPYDGFYLPWRRHGGVSIKTMAHFV